MSVMTCTSFGLGLSPHNSASAQELSRQQLESGRHELWESYVPSQALIGTSWTGSSTLRMVPQCVKRMRQASCM